MYCPKTPKNERWEVDVYMLLFKSGFTSTHILAMNDSTCVFYVLASEAFTTDLLVYTSTHDNEPELNDKSDSKPHLPRTAKPKIHY